MTACVESFERLLGITSKAGGGLGFPLEPDAWTAQHLITSLQSIKEGEGSGCRMPGSAQLLNYCIYFSKQQLTSSAALQRGAYRYFLSLSLSLFLASRTTTALVATYSTVQVQVHAKKGLIRPVVCTAASTSHRHLSERRWPTITRSRGPLCGEQSRPCWSMH